MPDSDHVIDACLDAIAQAPDHNAVFDVIARYRRQLIGDPAVARRLVHRAIAAESHDPAQPMLQLLERCLDEARMDVTGSGSRGRPFLDAAERAVTDAVRANRIGFRTAAALATAFGRAECAVPQALQSVEWPSHDALGHGSVPGELADLLDEVEQSAAGDAFQLYHGLRQTMGILPAETRRVLVQATMARGERLHQHLGLYWLFDPDPELRLEAARALGGLLDALDPGLRAWLPRLCRLLPEDESRRHLAAMMADTPQQPAPVRENPVDAWASIPDGAGTQTVFLAAGTADDRTLALVMLRAGEGVQEAFTMVGDSENQGETLSSIMKTDARRVPVATARTLLMVGAAENLAGDSPPPPGFADVLMAAGFADVTLPSPQPDWLAILRAKDAVASLTKQKRGRLINASAHWSEKHALVGMWFEGPGTFTDLPPTASFDRMERHVLAYLESRRAWWRDLILRAAAVLQGNGDADWRSFAVTAQALADGRALKKVPVMEEILGRSLDALQDQVARTRDTPTGGDHTPIPADTMDDGAGWSWLAGLPIEIVKSEPPAADAVPDLLAAAGRPTEPAWLDGYVMGVTTGPKPLPLQTWAAALAGPVEATRGPDARRRFEDLLLDRHAAVSNVLAESSEVQAWLRGYDGDQYAAWAAGFTAAVTEHPGAWPRHRVRKADRRVLDDLAAVGDGQPPAFTAQVVGSWLADRAAGKR